MIDHRARKFFGWVCMSQFDLSCLRVIKKISIVELVACGLQPSPQMCQARGLLGYVHWLSLNNPSFTHLFFSKDNIGASNRRVYL